jgi:hypothetical protein
LGETVHIITDNAEALVVASKEIGLDVNADKTKHMAMSGEQHGGRSHSMKIDNSFERVEEFKCLGTAVTNQKEEIRGRLKSGSACCNSVQNLCLLVCYPKI